MVTFMGRNPILLSMKVLAVIAAIMLASVRIAEAAEIRPYIVVDIKSGAVLSANEPFKKWYPASLTKLMTAYVAFNALRQGRVTLKSPVVMTRNAASEPPSKMGYKPGSVMTLENALRMMLVKSANDISVAVAETVSGSEQGFVGQMNSDASKLGMFATHFANPNGLFSRKNYSNARDLAVLVTTLRSEFPEYSKFFSIEALRLGKRVTRNYNTLLGRFDGADGMKTGFVCESGFNLAATATRKGRTIAAIVLGANSSVERAEQTADLLAAGFKTTGEGQPTLADMKPFGDLETVTNLRPVICARKARAGRRTKRDKNGHIIFRTKNLHPFYGAPAAVSVGLGGAEGITGSFIEFADVPVPAPRPKDAPVTEASGPTPMDVVDSGDVEDVAESDAGTSEIMLPPPVMMLPPFQATPQQ
jgi:D-alanyl-D-alanine carboxypeptidase